MDKIANKVIETRGCNLGPWHFRSSQKYVCSNLKLHKIIENEDSIIFRGVSKQNLSSKESSHKAGYPFSGCFVLLGGLLTASKSNNNYALYFTEWKLLGEGEDLAVLYRAIYGDDYYVF